MRTFRLSKSRITAGLQCGKRLWLVIHRPELEVYSADTQRRFAAGNSVGEVARKLYGAGELIDGGRNLSQALRDTEAALAASGDVTRTLGSAMAASSARDEECTSRPRAMMTTSSTVCSTSDSTWLETKTVRPSAAR